LSLKAAIADSMSSIVVLRASTTEDGVYKLVIEFKLTSWSRSHVGEHLLELGNISTDFLYTCFQFGF